MKIQTRRDFLKQTTLGLGVAGAASQFAPLLAQTAGERPPRDASVSVLNPRARQPVGLIIDDSTCLVNLNRFAMPQFDEANDHKLAVYHRNWREWPVEIPDSFVRKFGEWCAGQGVKGKYSIVPFPACVGRLDRMLPGWTQRELNDSLELVRTLMLPNWDIHPEMNTHTRVIDTKTGHPHTDHSLKFMENWEWTRGRSADEIADYMSYALRILKNVGLPCEGITTPGGFGSNARPQLAQASFQSVRDVFGAEIPHYFRDLYSEGSESVAPRIENASGLDGNDPRCVVSILGCTGDWTGGWDNTPPGGVDKFITEDLKSGRMVDIIARGEPALMLAHWTGVYWNGQELGFKIFQEVVRRLKSKYDHLIWMKLSEVARYWAAKELTRIERIANTISFRAPFACPDFTVRCNAPANAAPRLRAPANSKPLSEISDPLKLVPGSWCREGEKLTFCFALSKGESKLELLD
ncbi:MAG: twin-arginine translocation signal domain-containing protein [Verrucomicrobia bacterium]|nr:twin-arginine translocation signal domain-containing protein [Verrucomicrobiota bacterium]